MSDEINESTKCGTCGYVFLNNDIDQDSPDRQLCPKCHTLNIYPSLTENVVLYESMGLKAKKQNSQHKDNRADYESEGGMKKGKDGNLVFKKKIIDREHPNSPGSYVEYVRDKDGNIIVNKSEKLSEHTETLKNKKK